MTTGNKHIAASVRRRLLNESRARHVDFNLILTRFAIERFLYRLSRSPYTQQFVLKGAMLLRLWLPEMGRATRDLDLAGFGEISADGLRTIFSEVCVQPVEDDGARFLPESVRVESIRGFDEYGGFRVTCEGQLESVQLHVRVDIGIGDQLTPSAQWIDYPVLLDLPRPRVRAYRPETAIAEKVQAMVWLDLQNSRMKDFYDVWRLAEALPFDGPDLVEAVRQTFARRGTDVPAGLPVALTAEFAKLSSKQRQWQAFLSKSRLGDAPEDLAEVLEHIAVFLGPVLGAARSGRSLEMIWPPGGPWEERPTG